MAIYHLSARTGSRKYASSAKAKAQYILREGRYAGDSGEVLFSESAHMPTWAAEDAVDYWDMADCYERANGRLFKELEVALPVELNLEQQIELAQDFVKLLTEGEKLPYTLAIHEGGGGNPHFHVMLSPRRNDEVERPREQWCRRYNAKAPEKGGAQKTVTMRHRDWLIRARESWTVEANHALRQAGRPERISHLSLEDQGIERTPQIHRGAGVDALERRGVSTERGDVYREIERENLQRLEEAKRTKALKEAEGVENLRRAREQREVMLRQQREEAEALRAKVALAKKKKKELEERERQKQVVEAEEQWSSWLSDESGLLGKPEISKAESELSAAILNKDFRGLGLRNQVLRDLDLRNADFTGTTLIDVKFVNVDLSSARFDRTWMERVQFEGGSMKAARLQASMLRDVVFKGSKGHPLALSESVWVGVEFSGDLSCVSMKMSTFEDCAWDVGGLRQLDLRLARGLQFEKALSERILKNNAELNRSLFERKGFSNIPKEGVEGVVVAHAYFASRVEPCGAEEMSIVEAGDGRRFVARGARKIGARVRFPAKDVPKKELKPPKKDRGFER